ncbi:hypothetical protein C8J57DRAFT_1558541 [Mycena rebaudengoi]|nr:hypothetical protein C8J57DRAFT_1558541 [Mycena rebaudengoi]
MPTTTKFKSLIQYTILAANTAQNIAETAKVPFLGSTSALCLSITKCIETTKLNKEECAEMMEYIHEILCIIVQLHTTSEIKGVLPTAVLYDIAKFTEALERLFTIVNGQQKGTLGKIKGLFRQPEAAERLEKCKQELIRMVELFKMKKDAKEQHEQLVALLETDSDLTSSDRSSELWQNWEIIGSFGLLPASPQIFHGHEAELQDIVDILVQDSAHIAILGAEGMGKTSLATAGEFGGSAGARIRASAKKGEKAEEGDEEGVKGDEINADVELIEHADDLEDGEPFPVRYYGPLTRLWSEEVVRTAWGRGSEQAVPEKYVSVSFQLIIHSSSSNATPASMFYMSCIIRTRHSASFLLLCPSNPPLVSSSSLLPPTCPYPPSPPSPGPHLHHTHAHPLPTASNTSSPTSRRGKRCQGLHL